MTLSAISDQRTAANSIATRSPHRLVHAKAVVADGASVVLGSANWTVSGFEHNHELDVAIPGDTAIATALEQQFSSDWMSSG